MVPHSKYKFSAEFKISFDPPFDIFLSSFAIEQKLESYGIRLPSITFCLKRDDFWHKKTIDGFIKDKNYTHFNQLFDKTVNFSSVLKWLLISNDEKYIKYNEKWKHLGKI